MTSWPTQTLDLHPSRVRSACLLALWGLQAFVFLLMPFLHALLLFLAGSLVSLHELRRAQVRKLVLMPDGRLGIDDAAPARLRQTQGFLGVCVLMRDGRGAIGVWPDALSREHASALQRWLRWCARRTEAPGSRSESKAG